MTITWVIVVREELEFLYYYPRLRMSQVWLKMCPSCIDFGEQSSLCVTNQVYAAALDYIILPFIKQAKSLYHHHTYIPAQFFVYLR